MTQSAWCVASTAAVIMQSVCPWQKLETRPIRKNAFNGHFRFWGNANIKNGIYHKDSNYIFGQTRCWNLLESMKKPFTIVKCALFIATQTTKLGDVCKTFAFGSGATRRQRARLVTETARQAGCAPSAFAQRPQHAATTSSLCRTGRQQGARPLATEDEAGGDGEKGR